MLSTKKNSLKLKDFRETRQGNYQQDAIACTAKLLQKISQAGSKDASPTRSRTSALVRKRPLEGKRVRRSRVEPCADQAEAAHPITLSLIEIASHFKRETQAELLEIIAEKHSKAHIRMLAELALENLQNS